MKLYEINEQIRQALSAAGDDGEITDAQAEALDALDVAFHEKVEATALFVRELMAESDAVKAEADRLASRARAIKNRADGLRGYLLAQMVACGVDKLKGRLATVAVQDGPPRVEVDDDRAIPCGYWTQPSPVMDKQAIKAALAAGTDVPGARLVAGRHLRIR